MNRNRKLLVAACVIVVGFVVYLLVRRPANVNLYVSPSPATVIVDGAQHVHSGRFYLKPGHHTLAASFNGFYSQTIDFTATRQQQPLNILLNPSSQAGFDWLKNHPKEQQQREKIGGEQYNQAASKLLSRYPIVAQLPYQGPGGEYEVGYGSITNGKLEIDITFYTVKGKTTALRWLQAQGYSMQTFNVQYIDKTYQPPVVNNPYTN